MTSTVPRVQPYRLYRFFGADGTLLYVGMTGRIPVKRLMEHVADKPWASEMASWQVDPQTWWSEADVLAAEKHAIVTERPRYNTIHNGRNPHRVYAGPTRRSRAYAPAAQFVRRAGRPWWATKLFWAVVVLAVEFVAWWIGMASSPDLTVGESAGGAAFLTAVSVGAAGLARSEWRKKKRQLRRRGWI